VRKRIVVVLAALCLGFQLWLPAVTAAGMSDTTGHWAEVHIDKWISDGLITGYPDGSFKPDNSITRAELVALVNRAFDIPNQNLTSSFSDIKASDWFYSDVISGQAAGYISGYPDGTFRPNNPITRQEAASLITNLLDLNPGNTNAINAFTDNQSIDEWAKPGISAVVTQGIMNGFPDKTFGPRKNITRAETVVTLDKALNFEPDEISGIKGIVKLSSQPVKGATVRVFVKGSHESLKNTVTGPDGAFTFAVPDGQYEITAIQDKNVGYAGPVTVTGGNTSSTQEVLLTTGARVTGKLVGQSSKALANTPVYFTTNPSFVGKTNNYGEFSMVLPMRGPAGQLLSYTGFCFHNGSRHDFATGQQFTADTDLGQLNTNVPGQTTSGGGGGGDGAPSDTTAPSISGASVSGSSLQLSFDEPLDVTSKPQGGDFSIRVNGTEQDLPASVNISGAVVTITLTEAVQPGDSVTVSYSPGANPLRDLAGNRVASFAGRAVTNNTASLVIPELDRSQATRLIDSTAFLYSGPDPIQTGVAEGTIEEKRVAVIRGRVLNRDNQPLKDVRITILNHSEFGSTVSRDDGYFDMAVNGGGLLTLHYEKDNFITAQRQADVPWQDFLVLPDVVMIPYDSNATSINLTANTMQIAEGSQVTDADGTRKARLIFPAGVTADVGGNPLSDLTIRITEYTVGANGPEAMPAILPPNVGYTYCVEYSADEAGTNRVNFSQPIYHYVENFIGFPVGGLVPMGYYDYEQAAWIPSENGRVIKILDINGGMADLDLDGSGVTADAAALTALGVTDDERKKLAALYGAGQELWRVPITHFSPWDCNWPIAPPEDAQPPKVPQPMKPYLDDPCRGRGSVIEYQNQALGESANVYGTSFSLNYNSSRVEGCQANRIVEIPITGAEALPASLKEIRLVVRVAGKKVTETFHDWTPNQVYSFIWDGKDAYGRVIQGSVPIEVELAYVYQGYYASPASFPRSFGENGGAVLEVNRAALEVIFWQNWSDIISNWDGTDVGIGGWSLDVHHSFNAANKTLYFGDGSQTATSNQTIVFNVAGTGVDAFSGDGGPALDAELDAPFGVSIGADGSIYIADSFNQRLRKISPEGTITTIAGNPNGSALDNGPARMLSFLAPLSLAMGPDGSHYFAENATHRIRRVSPDGMLSVVAGTGEYGLSGDGGPARDAQLNSPIGIAVASDGSIYIADGNNHRIRRVSPDGIITTVAGTAVAVEQGTYGGDGGPASEAQLNYPADVAIGPEGSLYIADSGNNRIRRVGIDGIITTVAGNGSAAYSGDGGPATWAGLQNPRGVEVSPDGTIYISDTLNHCIRKVTPDGIISTVGGTGVPGYVSEDSPASEAQFEYPIGLALSPDGSIYVADRGNNRIRRIGQPSLGIETSDFVIPDESGNQLFIFDQNGLHKSTLNALTGSAIFSFT
jgi:uncharacterized repeat protein (TIGR02059 family)